MKLKFILLLFIFFLLIKKSESQSYTNEVVPVTLTISNNFKKSSVRFFPLSQVKLLNSPFSHAQDLDASYLLSLKPDRLLHRFHKNAGLVVKDSIYGGWEQEGLSGHTLGHYLSAISMMYASTGKPEFLERTNYVVNELALCQKARKTGYVGAIPNEDSLFSKVSRGEIKSGGFDLNGGWSPWYTVHKVMAGLADAYAFTKNYQALEVLKKMGDWTNSTVAHLSEDLRLKMLNCEYGGMADVLAFLYQVTGEKKYLDLSYKFTDEFVMGKLAKGVDPMPGKHSNTNVPKAIGAARQYEITALKSDSLIATNFWNNMVHHHSYVIGGNSNYEYCGARDSLNDRLSDNTCETCNTYNMLKLTKHLFSWCPNSAQMDFYEKALYNHILASQNSQSGMMCYFVPLRMGTKKQFSDETNTFTCCVGSGMENHTKYAESIYAYDQANTLYFNLYIPSILNWTQTGTLLTMNADLPETDSVIITIDKVSNNLMHWKFRKPYWVTGKINCFLNGKEFDLIETKDGYLSLSRKFRKGDQIILKFPMQPYTESMPDNPNRIAIKYGPWVMAANLGLERPDPTMGVPVLMGGQQAIKNWLIKRKGSLELSTNKTGQPFDFTMKPFYQFNDEYYSVYFDFFTQQDWADKKAAYELERKKEKELEEKTIDFFRIGEMQPERDHQLFATEKSYVDDAMGVKGREARKDNYFEFNMNAGEGNAQKLILTLLGDDKNRIFDVLADNELIETVRWNGGLTGKFYQIELNLPQKLISEKKQIRIKILASHQTTAGRIFGVRTIRE